MDTFFAQGGYAFYVWSAYGMALLLLVLDLVQLSRRRRALLGPSRPHAEGAGVEDTGEQRHLGHT